MKRGGCGRGADAKHTTTSFLQHVKEMAQTGAKIAKEGLTVPTPSNIKEMVYGGGPQK